MRYVRSAVSALAIIGIFAVVAPARAQFTPVNQPSDLVGGLPYAAPSGPQATTLIDVTAPELSTFTTMTDGTLTLTFGLAQQARTVGANWATWGSPPDTETNRPRIAYNTTSVLRILLSMPVSIFGFELEPDPFGAFSFTANFNGTTGGTITRTVNGSAGAKLFAASTSGGFTSVDISGPVDFATARFRYGLTLGQQDVPEPGTYAMLGSMGVGGLGFWLRRRKVA